MVNNLTMGPVQVFSNDVASLNDALQQVSSRIDELKGLRGRGETFDRLRVDDPLVAQDAETLGSSGVSAAEQRARKYALLVRGR